VTAFPEQQGVRPPGAASADAPPAESAASPRDAPLLGSLLIEHGLLNEEQLAAALAEQRRSGAPLGKVLIELGFIEPAVVALALATQSGGVLKTEYGFATGFRPRQEGAPVLEPPLSGPEEEKAGESELRIAPPPPAAETVASQPTAQAPAQASFPDSPTDFAGPLWKEQSDEPVQVEPEDGGQHEVEAGPLELATPPPPGPKDLAEPAGGLAAVEDTETILPTIADETDLALLPEPPESDQQVDMGPLELAAPPSTGSEDLAAFTSGLAAIEEETETILSDLQTIAAETGLALASERPVTDQQVESDPALHEHATAAESEEAPSETGAVTGGTDTAPDELDAAAARITALEAELAAAQEHSRQLRSQVAVLEGEIDAARLGAETATAERVAAEATALTALARVEQLERELALARAGNGALRSENDVLRAEEAFERLTEIEQRLATVTAQMDALRELGSDRRSRWTHVGEFQ
jgi:flagellin-like hook-associated protein FlgL